jgi:hypothetical protein
MDEVNGNSLSCDLKDMLIELLADKFLLIAVFPLPPPLSFLSTITMGPSKSS